MLPCLSESQQQHGIWPALMLSGWLTFIAEQVSFCLVAGGNWSQRGRWEGGKKGRWGGRGPGGVSLVMWPDYQHLVVNNGGGLLSHWDVTLSPSLRHQVAVPLSIILV